MLGAPGLPRDAEECRSGNVVLKLGGASRENPGISDGFSGRDFMVGELARDGVELLDTVEAGLVIEDDRLDGAELMDTVDAAGSLLVGVADLDAGLTEADGNCLDGVEDLTGVDDRRGGACDFVGKLTREVGVEGLLGGFEVVVTVGRPVGVAGLDPL